MPSVSTRAYAQALALFLFGGCHQESLSDGLPPAAEESSSGASRGLQTKSIEPVVAEGPVDEPETLEPIAILRATRAYTVFASASKGSPPRGRILRGSDFHIFSRQDDSECDDGWVQVSGGWICSDRAKVVEVEPVSLPKLPKGSDVPFIYARHRGHRDTATPPLEVFRSIRELKKDADPISTLAAYGSHAFSRRTWNEGEPILLTASGRAVPAKDMARFRPSRFEGRDLEADPVPRGKILSWTPYDESPVFAAPDLESEKVSTLPRHSELLVLPIVGDGDWVKLNGEISGFIQTSDLRSFTPAPPERSTSSDELTIDVELNDQILSLWRGTTPIFATLISSGKAGDRTPLGLYSIGTKWAFSKMENRKGDDPYFVEAVPWTMYFSGRYAMHASYWHNRFGQRVSHGCINISPRDSKRIFELTSPALPAGWLLVHALDSEPGTTLRIRRGDRPVPDQRDQ